MATPAASAAGASIAWEGAKAPPWEDSVELGPAEALGLEAKEASATVSVPGQDSVAALAVGLGLASVVGPGSALVEASVVVLEASAEGLMAGLGDKASPPAPRAASGR